MNLKPSFMTLEKKKIKEVIEKGCHKVLNVDADNLDWIAVSIQPRGCISANVRCAFSKMTRVYVSWLLLCSCKAAQVVIKRSHLNNLYFMSYKRGKCLNSQSVNHWIHFLTLYHCCGEVNPCDKHLYCFKEWNEKYWLSFWGKLLA